jgi:hypothetical protein
MNQKVQRISEAYLSRVQGAGCRVQGAGCRVQGAGGGGGGGLFSRVQQKGRR